MTNYRNFVQLKNSTFISFILAPALLGSGQPSASEQVVAALDAVSTTRPIKELIMGYIGNKYAPFLELESSKDLSSVAITNNSISACRNEFNKRDIATWQLQTGQKLRSIKTKWPMRMAYSPDGTYMAVIDNNSLRFYDTKTADEINIPLSKKLSALFTEQKISINWLEFGSCSKKIYVNAEKVNTWDSTPHFILEVDIETASINLFQDTDHVTCFAVSPATNAPFILTAGAKYIHFLKQNRTEQVTLNSILPEFLRSRSNLHISTIAVSRDGKMFAAAVFTSAFGIREQYILFGVIKDHKIARHHLIPNEFKTIEQLVFTPDNAWLIAVCSEVVQINTKVGQMDKEIRGILKRYNVTTGVLDNFLVASPPVSHVNFSPDGNYMAISNVERTIQVLKSTPDIECAHE